MQRFDTNPPLRTFQYTAYALGAVLPHGKEAEAILDNNYIQLESDTDIGANRHLVRFSPFIGPTNFSRSGLGFQASFRPATPGDLCTALLSALAKGFVVRLLVDEFHIPHRWAYRRHHKLHDVLVIGADWKEKAVSIVGYCSDRRYRESVCSLRELCTAFFLDSKMVEILGPRLLQIERFIAFKYSRETPIMVDGPGVLKSLTCFIEGKSLRSQDGNAVSAAEKICHGTEVYALVVRYLKALNPGQGTFDRRPFSILSEHAHAMAQRARRLLPPTTVTENGFQQDLIASCRTADRLRLLSLVSADSLTQGHFDLMALLSEILRDSVRRCADHMHRSLAALYS